MLNGLKGSAHPDPIFRREQLNCDRVRRWYSVINVVDLLRKDKFDKCFLCLSKRIEIGFRPNSQGLDSSKPGKGRTFDHMMANCEHTGCAYNSKQAGLLQIDTAPVGLELSKKSKATFNAACGLRQQLGEVISAARNVVCLPPKCGAKSPISVHRTQIEKDINCQEILWPGDAHPFLNATAPCRHRAAPLRILGHDAPRAVGHTDFVQDVSDVGTEFFEPNILCAPGLALGKNGRVILVHRK